VICIGDCGDDGTVTIDEVIILVDIALGTQPLSTCEAGHLSTVTVADLVTAVNNALSGCNAGGARFVHH
jgi:hypothetical protein